LASSMPSRACIVNDAVSQTIWYISKYVAPTYAATACSRGFSLLKEMARSGHRCALITSDANHFATAPEFSGRVFAESVDGVDTYWLKTRKFSQPRSVGRILSWLHFEWQLWRMPKKTLPRPNHIIVSSLSLLTILNGLWLRRKFGCKLVFEVRDIWPLMLVATGGMKPGHPIVRLLGMIERAGYKYADLIVGTMPRLDWHVEKILGKPKPVVCIPQGVDADFFANQHVLPADYVARHFPPGKFIICYAGSLGNDNEISTLLSCARAMADNQEFCFVIIGDGPKRAQLISENADLANVVFAPAVKKSMVQDALRHADILYFSVHDNQLGTYGQSLNKVIDYMYAGKPVIGSFSGFPSMIDEADCGAFIPASDARALQAEVERYAALSPGERAQIGVRGRAWLLRERSFEKLASDYLLALGQLTDSARP
jgi:glycosyltransferase involved in cell wall biosynthesis